MPEQQTEIPTLARIRQQYREAHELLETAVRIEDECRDVFEDQRDAEWQRRIHDVVATQLGQDFPLDAGGDSGDPIDYTLDVIRSMIEKLSGVSDA